MLITEEQAVYLLGRDEVVAIPTETVFGLAGSYKSKIAIQKIFTLKGRPSNNPLIVHISSYEEVDKLASSLPPYSEKLMDSFWPGPLTLVLPAHPSLLNTLRGGLPTVAVRMPDHKNCLQLLQKTGPLVAPSANLSGKPSSSLVKHIEEDFGPDFPILEGAPVEKGIESTVLLFSEGMWQIARLGALAKEEIESVLHTSVPLLKKSDLPLSPGQCYKHYSPAAKIFTGKTYQKESPLVIGFKERSYAGSSEVWTWGSEKHPEDALKNLYLLLRQVDERKHPTVWIDIDFPELGLFQTLHERVLKASSC